MRCLAAFVLIVISCTLLPLTSHAQYVSNICDGGASCEKETRVGDPSRCMSCEVGVFMAGISKECGNTGTCSLLDIEQVFVSTGQFILGIIGSIVLLMYFVGGMYFLTSAGAPSKIQKGRDYLKISTIGLLIVMFAYFAIQVLQTTITTSVEDQKTAAEGAEGAENVQQNAKDFTNWVKKQLDLF